MEAFYKRFINHWAPGLGRGLFRSGPGQDGSCCRCQVQFFPEVYVGQCRLSVASWVIWGVSASQESLWARCPQLHFQPEGDGVSHQGGCGGWGYQYWLCGTMPLCENPCSLSMTHSVFLEQVSGLLWVSGASGPGSEAKYCNDNKRGRERTGEETYDGE